MTICALLYKLLHYIPSSSLVQSAAHGTSNQEAVRSNPRTAIFLAADENILQYKMWVSENKNEQWNFIIFSQRFSKGVWLFFHYAQELPYRYAAHIDLSLCSNVYKCLNKRKFNYFLSSPFLSMGLTSNKRKTLGLSQWYFWSIHWYFTTQWHKYTAISLKSDPKSRSINFAV